MKYTPGFTLTRFLALSLLLTAGGAPATPVPNAIALTTPHLAPTLKGHKPAHSQRDTLIVYRPRITYPKHGTHWLAGSSYTVTWDHSHVPEEKKNATGVLLLGYEKGESENLDIDHPLASNFPIVAGSVPITVPKNTSDGDKYFVVLFGDSGNRSPEFSITSPS